MSNPGSLIVHGLVRLNEGKDASLPVPRIVKTLPYLIVTGNEDANDPIHQDCPPVSSTSNTQMDIQLYLGKRLSKGNHHTVYTVNLSANEDVSSHPPRMVIKVSAEREGHRLAREAAMYDYLKPLQGRVIPRCYGYFRCIVNLIESVVTPWSPPHLTFPRDKSLFNIFRMPNANACLNILLLEYAGTPVDTHPSVSIDELR